MSSVAEVRLWGRRIGAVSIGDESPHAAFEYDPAFVASGIQVSPLRMPLERRVYRFPELPRATFNGLPGLLSDSLPDRYGNALIDAWLASQGRDADSFNAVERLCYTGARGMGALEYRPAHGPRPRRAHQIDIDTLVELASDILSQRHALHGSFAGADREQALREILRVGTSAGGARAKAVIAWNRASNEVCSGQIEAGEGFEYWILKFDGVHSEREDIMQGPRGYGAIEYAYSLMAKAAGIHMPETRLLEENGRRHFMSRRFDRSDDGGKLHMQTLGALAHFDYNAPGSNSYEQVFDVIRRLDLGIDAVEEQFRRMLLNVLARNQDDHVKNIAFLMDKEGRWRLSPAYDVTYSHNPEGRWTSRHQLSLNGRRDRFSRDDIRQCARHAALKRGRADALFEQVRDAVSQWTRHADEAGVEPAWRDQIAGQLRLHWTRS